MSHPIFIGICGGSGSGKTYLLDQLKSRFNLDCSICSLDDYYKVKDDQEKDVNGVINFDLPSALDTVKLKEDLETLKSGKSIFQTEYHFNIDKEECIKEIKSAPIIIVEGLFVFEYDFVRALLDYSIYVKVDEETQLRRRLRRDMEERGYSKEDILYQWNNHVIPCYNNYLRPYREKANFLFNNGDSFEIEFSRLVKDLENHLVFNA
jgi:uridine kinase